MENKLVEVGEYLLSEEILITYQYKDYPLYLDRICNAIDIGGGQTTDINGVLLALDKAGYKITLK